MNSSRPLWPIVSLVVLFVVLGGWLRFSIAGSELCWLDELHTGWVVNDSLTEVASRATSGNQTPLYFWLVWCVTAILEPNEFGLRFVSCFTSLIVIAFSLRWTWVRTRSLEAAFATGYLVAFGSLFVFYGTEARPYGLMHLVSLIQVFLFWKLLRTIGLGLESAEDQPINRGADFWLPLSFLAIATAALVYTHLTSALLIMAELVFVLILCIRFPAMRFSLLKTLVCVTGICLLVCLPVLSSFLFVFGRSENWSPVASVVELWTDFWPVALTSLAVPLIGVEIGKFVDAKYDDEPTKQPEDSELSAEIQDSSQSNWLIALLWTCGLVPVALLVIAQFLNVPMAMTRYAQVGAVVLPLAAGMMIGGLRNAWLRLIVCASVVVLSTLLNPMILQSVQIGAIPKFRSENWELPISEVNKMKRKASQPMFLLSNLIEDVDAIDQNDSAKFQEYLCFPVHSLYPVDAGIKTIARPTLSEIHFDETDIRLMGENGGGWVLIRGFPEMVQQVADQLEDMFQLQYPDRDVSISILEVPESPVFLLSIDF